MLARCAFCQKNFDTDRFGVQPCPHCGQQVHLADPSAPAPTQPPLRWPRPRRVVGVRRPEHPPPGAPWAVGEADAPFALRSSQGFLQTYVSTWKLACLQPAEFFRSVKIGAPGRRCSSGSSP